MQKKLKIAFLLGSPDISGGTNVIFHHAAALGKMGHEVVILTEQAFEKSRARWHPQAANLRFSTFENQTQNFDLAIATWWRTVFDLPQVSAKKYVFFVQSIESRFFLDLDFDLKHLVRFAFQMPILVITECEWIADFLSEEFGRECEVVRNGVDKSHLRRRQKNPKNFSVLVEGPLGVFFKNTEKAIEMAQKSGAENIFLLTSSSVKKYAGVKKVFSRVRQNQVGKVLQNADVLVKTSTVEGMFGPPLEMFASGGTAVCTRATGSEMFLRNGQNSGVFEINQTQEMIDFLAELREDPSQLRALQTAAAKTAENWIDWSTSSRNFERGLQKFIQQKEDKPQNTQMQKSLAAALKLAGALHQIQMAPYSIRELFGEIFRLFVDAFRRRNRLHDPILLAQIEAAESELNEIKNPKIANSLHAILKLIYASQHEKTTFGAAISHSISAVKNTSTRAKFCPKIPKFFRADLEEDFQKFPDFTPPKFRFKKWQNRQIDLCVVADFSKKSNQKFLAFLESLPQKWQIAAVGKDRKFLGAVLAHSKIAVFPEKNFDAKNFFFALSVGAILVKKNSQKYFWHLEFDEHFFNFGDRQNLHRILTQIFAAPEMFETFYSRPRKILADSNLLF